MSDIPLAMAEHEEKKATRGALQDTSGHYRTLQDTTGHCRTLQDTAGALRGNYRSTAGHCRTLHLQLLVQGKHKRLLLSVTRQCPLVLLVKVGWRLGKALGSMLLGVCSTGREVGIGG